MPLPSSCQTRCERLRAESLRQVTIVGPTYSKCVRLCFFCLVDYPDSSLHQRVFLFLQSPLAASTHSRESATLPFPSPSWSTLAPTANSPPSISPFSVALGVLGTVGFAAPVVAACWAGEPSAWLEDKHGEANHDVSHYLRHLLLVCLLCCVMSHLNLFSMRWFGMWTAAALLACC
jgi:hypothetical protein